MKVPWLSLSVSPAGPRLKTRRVIVHFCTGALDNSSTRLKYIGIPIDHFLLAARVRSYFLAFVGWVFMVGLSNKAIDHQHFPLFLVLFIGLLSVPFIIADQATKYIWVRLIVSVDGRVFDIAWLIGLTFYLLAAFVTIATLDGVGALGNRDCFP